MEQPGRLPLHGDRWTPFVRTLTFEGIDLTGADMRAQVRLYPDALGSPHVDLLTVETANTQGLRLLSAGLVGGVMTSIVYMRINETVMEAMPFTGEAGEDSELYWDMHIDPVGGVKQKYLYGTFTVRAGVTK